MDQAMRSDDSCVHPLGTPERERLDRAIADSEEVGFVKFRPC